MSDIRSEFDGAFEEVLGKYPENGDNEEKALWHLDRRATLWAAKWMAVYLKRPDVAKELQ